MTAEPDSSRLRLPVSGIIAVGTLLAVYFPQGMACEGGRISGTVVDSAWAVIPNATIRAIPKPIGKTKYRTLSANDGSFRLEGIEGGKYRVAISAPGFRETLIDNVSLEEGRQVDLGEVLLPFGGCDAPGVVCDSFSSKLVVDRRSSYGYLTVPTGCAADIDKGTVLCTVVLDGPQPKSPMRDSIPDFWIHATDGNGIYFEPLNGARLAEPDSATADCGSAVFLGHRVRVDGLGLGGDLCLRSNAGRYSHVFFTSEVQPDSERVVIYYVTRR